ncbi:MAG: ATP-binding protein [Clostridia bacterium]|nr:ATP-binding protein [Clostridia bacterium]
MNKKRQGRVYFFGVAALIVLVIATIVFSCYYNTKANFEHISMFTEEFSATTAKYVATVFRDKLSSVESAAYLYGTSLESREPDLALLKELEEKTDFAHIRFISSEGTDFASDGTEVSVIDREYFIRGMRGKSGMCFVPESRVNGERLVGFYAPVYFENDILGLMVGFLSEGDMSRILSKDVWNYTLDSYVMDIDGTVLAGNPAAGGLVPADLREALPDMDLDERNNVLKAVMFEQEYSFYFGNFLRRTTGYVMPIDGTHWVLVEMVPEQISFAIGETSLRYNLIILLCFAAGLIILSLFMLRYYRKQSKLRAEEDTARRISSIMGLLNEDYELLCDVNLRTGEELMYHIKSGHLNQEWPEDRGMYNDILSFFADSFVAEYDRERFLAASSLENVTKVLRTRNASYVDYDVIVNGEIRQYQGKHVISHEPDGDRMLISVRDVTEIIKETKQRERELTEARNLAESANRAKSSFLFNMSRDIRTPMNAIVGFTNLLSKNLEDTEKARNYIGKIQTSGDFLLSLINNVLEMARIESGKTELHETACNLNSFCDMLTSVFEEQMKEKNISFSSSVDVTNCDVMCDSTKLREIYLNILSNAVKYTSPGGSISMTLEEIQSESEGVSLYRGTVKDTGIGMSEEYLATIFEEFTRESTVTQSNIMGTGLGMPIVKRLVELMNGEIIINSRQGEGTSVIITIPHRIAEVSQDNTPEEDIQNINQDYSGIRILLAEDNDLNAEIATEILSEYGFSIDRAKDGRECVTMLTEHSVDYYSLVLMDVQMPEMDGYEATGTIRSLESGHKDIVIIAMTANAFEEDKQNAFAAGMNGHISKPIEIPVLLRVISKVLEGKA